MDKSEFFALAQAHAKDSLDWSAYRLERELPQLWTPAPEKTPTKKKSAAHSKEMLPLAFFRKAETGGASGGSCWGGEARAYSTTVEDPGLGAVLDEFLEKVAPDVSFLTYRKMVRAVEFTDTRESEYYGNYTNYRVWYLPIETLWELLEPHFEKQPATPAG